MHCLFVSILWLSPAVFIWYPCTESCSVTGRYIILLFLVRTWPTSVGSHSTVTALTQHSHCTLTALTQHTHCTLTALTLHSHSTLIALSLHSHSTHTHSHCTLTALTQHSHKTHMETHRNLNFKLLSVRVVYNLCSSLILLSSFFFICMHRL